MYKDLYYAEIFCPTCISTKFEEGFSHQTIVKNIGVDNRKRNQYECIQTKNIYFTGIDLAQSNSIVRGTQRIKTLIPLDKCFNMLGIFNNKELDTQTADNIKKLKKELKIRP